MQSKFVPSLALAAALVTIAGCSTEDATFDPRQIGQAERQASTSFVPQKLRPLPTTLQSQFLPDNSGNLNPSPPHEEPEKAALAPPKDTGAAAAARGHAPRRGEQPAGEGQRLRAGHRRKPRHRGRSPVRPRGLRERDVHGRPRGPIPASAFSTTTKSIWASVCGSYCLAAARSKRRISRRTTT